MKKIKIELVVSGNDEVEALRAIRNNMNRFWYDAKSFNIVVEECDG